MEDSSPLVKDPSASTSSSPRNRYVGSAKRKMSPVSTNANNGGYSYGEDEVAKAREALAQRGYPNPTAADIERVLQYVHQGDDPVALASSSAINPVTISSTIGTCPPATGRSSHSTGAALHPQPQQPSSSSSMHERAAESQGVLVDRSSPCGPTMDAAGSVPSARHRQAAASSTSSVWRTSPGASSQRDGGAASSQHQQHQQQRAVPHLVSGASSSTGSHMQTTSSYPHHSRSSMMQRQSAAAGGGSHTSTTTGTGGGGGISARPQVIASSPPSFRDGQGNRVYEEGPEEQVSFHRNGGVGGGAAAAATTTADASHFTGFSSEWMMALDGLSHHPNQGVVGEGVHSTSGSGGGVYSVDPQQAFLQAAGTSSTRDDTPRNTSHDPRQGPLTSSSHQGVRRSPGGVIIPPGANPLVGPDDEMIVGDWQKKRGSSTANENPRESRSRAGMEANMDRRVKGRTTSATRAWTSSATVQRKPGWNDSTLVAGVHGAARINGPHFPPSTSAPYPPMPNAGPSRFAGELRAPPPHHGPIEAPKPGSPAAYLRPSARLERYINKYEKELGALYTRHPALAPDGYGTREESEALHRDDGNDNRSRSSSPAAFHNAEGIEEERTQKTLEHWGDEDKGDDEESMDMYDLFFHHYPNGVRQVPSWDLMGTGGARPRHSVSPSSSPHDTHEHRYPYYPAPRKHASRSPGAVLQMPLRMSAAATAANAQRAANVVFGITGDPRYRFRSSDAVRITKNGESPAERRNAPRDEGSPSHETAGVEGAKVAGGVVSSPPPRGTRPHPCVEPPIGTLSLSSYVDPTGSTLRRKADPVKRGEQMRMLWRRDSFLKKAVPGTVGWQRRMMSAGADSEDRKRGNSFRTSGDTTSGKADLIFRSRTKSKSHTQKKEGII